jgi:tetratricopeptide (TPR) repeat protein
MARTRANHGVRSATAAPRALATLGARVTLGALCVLGWWVGGAVSGCASKDRGGDQPEIVPQVDRAAELARAQRLQAQALAAQTDKDYDRAIRLYGEALTIDAGLGGAWHNAGVCFMEQSRYIEARDAFLRAAQLLPNDPRPYENLGVLYLERLGHARQAYEAFGQALQRDPRSSLALRGSTSAIRLLRLATVEALDRVSVGLESEADAEWRRIMNAERIRIEGSLRDARERS